MNRDELISKAIEAKLIYEYGGLIGLLAFDIEEALERLTKFADLITDPFEAEIIGLQAHINQLREALEVCKYDCNTGEVISIAREALSFTPAQSLKAHDDAIYEKGYEDGYNVCYDGIDND